jgi:threonine dehydratase
MQLSQVELDVSVETRGTDHRRQVIQALRAAGYDPVVDDEA